MICFRNARQRRFKERVNELQQVLDHQGILLRLFSSHEALIKPGLVEDILLELWSHTWLSETERIIFELRAFGIIPIVAHLERYRMIQQNPDRLVDLLQRGVSSQLTASSLVSIWGQDNSVLRRDIGQLKIYSLHCL
jgi:protein-tyrosine phosphatase